MKWELVRLPHAEGRIAAEGALPDPPGVLCRSGRSRRRRLRYSQRSARRDQPAAMLLHQSCRASISKKHYGRKQVWCYVIKLW
ncbi:hypothetical protein ACNKHR_03595 [Shigella flexneri]